jgi:hypothetical protein
MKTKTMRETLLLAIEMNETREKERARERGGQNSIYLRV